MTQKFTWRVTTDSSGDATYRVATSKFGDGYKQEVGDGLNNKEQAWKTTFVGYKSECEAVIAFLDDHEGHTPFYWKPPLHAQGLFTCKKYSVADNGGSFFTLSMEFEQAFAP